MPSTLAKSPASGSVARFVLRTRRPLASKKLTAVSLFSGGGLSDVGYLAAGFDLVVQAELDPNRAAVGQMNFPKSRWIVGDVRKTAEDIVKAYRMRRKRPLDLLVATPPCQGLSSSNPSRGKRATGGARRNASKNALLLRIISVARELKPRAIIAENVRQILTHSVYRGGAKRTIVEALSRELPRYEFWHMAVDMADYGVPQSRTRAVIVGVRKNELFVRDLSKSNLAPIPRPTHAQGGRDGCAPWVTVRQWCEYIGYPSLDASCADVAKGHDPLHAVPCYGPERYRLIADIPPHSGRSAYDNDVCPECKATRVSLGLAVCPSCGGVLWNRPIIRTKRGLRLIRGFNSSYRRMRSDRPAATITTNSSHVGSDWKIHPYENRVLSARECAEIQTVPRWYRWTAALQSRQMYLIRNLIGEALPPYFTYVHGQVLASLLMKGRIARQRLAAVD